MKLILKEYKGSNVVNQLYIDDILIAQNVNDVDSLLLFSGAVYESSETFVSDFCGEYTVKTYRHSSLLGDALGILSDEKLKDRAIEDIYAVWYGKDRLTLSKIESLQLLCKKYKGLNYYVEHCLLSHPYDKVEISDVRSLHYHINLYFNEG